MTQILVDLKDLDKLSHLICDLDDRKKNPTIDQIETIHLLIIKMMGENFKTYYMEDD